MSGLSCTLAAVVRAEPVLNIRPAHPLPYGQAYLRSPSGDVEILRALPLYQHETQHPAPDLDAPPLGIREGWRITIANQRNKPLRVRNLRLQVKEYSALTDPYVTLWRTRPPQIIQDTLVELKPDQRIIHLMPSDDLIEVAPKNAKLRIVNIVGGKPGVYRMVVQASIDVTDQERETVESKVFSLLIPNRQAEALESRLGVALVNAGPFAASIAERLLTVTSTVFVPLAQQTNPFAWLVQPPALTGLTKVINLPDADFAQRVRSWTKLASVREGVAPDELPQFALTSHGPSQALIRWEAGDPKSALDILTRYQAKMPDDPSTYPSLFRLLDETNQKQAMYRYWQWLLSSSLRGSGGFFEAGLISARTLRQPRVETQLLRTAIYAYPELVSLLSLRVEKSKNEPKELADILEQSCSLYPYVAEKGQFRDAFISGLTMLTTRPSEATPTILRRVHDSCPEDMRGVIRARAELWPFAPELTLNPPFALGVIRAWLRAGHLSRAMQAAQRLRYADDGESCEILEILGDLTVRASRLLEDPAYAAAAYQRALGDGQCDPSRIVALKAKHALALARAGEVEALDHLELTLRHERLDQQMDAGDAVVQIMHGWVKRNPSAVRDGLWHFYERGGAAEQIGVAGFTNQQLRTMRDQLQEGLDSMEGGIPGDIPLPPALVEWLLTAYGRERTLPRMPDSRSQQLYLATAERFLSRGQNNQLAFIIRQRGRVFIGVKRRWNHFVLTPKEEPLSSFIRNSPRDQRNLRARYLKPLPVSLVGADRAALEALMSYQVGNMSEARAKAKRALDIDELHTDAYFVLAQVDAVGRDYVGCKKQAAQLLQLDPNHPQAQSLMIFCDTMSRAKAARLD